MITALINWLGVYEDPNMPDDLKMGDLDRRHNISAYNRPTVMEEAA